MSFLDTDTNRPTQELISDILSAAVNQSHKPGLPLVPFATLLVRLSRESAATADKNLRVQNRMIIITSIVLVISIVQLVLAFLQFQSSSPNNSQGIVTTPQPVQSEADQKDVVKSKKPIVPYHVPVPNK